MKSLKEKFGKFEMSKEQQRKVLGGHCPPGISYGWCESKWFRGEIDGGGGYTRICDEQGLDACVGTCITCKKCNQPVPEYAN